MCGVVGFNISFFMTALFHLNEPISVFTFNENGISFPNYFLTRHLLNIKCPCNYFDCMLFLFTKTKLPKSVSYENIV